MLNNPYLFALYSAWKIDNKQVVSEQIINNRINPIKEIGIHIWNTEKKTYTK